MYSYKKLNILQAGESFSNIMVSGCPEIKYCCEIYIMKKNRSKNRTRPISVWQQRRKHFMSFMSTISEKSETPSTPCGSFQSQARDSNK